MRLPSIGLPLMLTLLAIAVACGPATSTGGDGDGDTDGGDEPMAACTVDDVGMRYAPGEAAQVPGGGAPDLSCVNNPVVLEAGTTATVEGCIEIFGIGSKSKPGLMVGVYSRDQNPKTETPDFGETTIAVAAQPGDLQQLAAQCESEGYYRITGIPTHVPLIFKVYDTATGAQKQAIDTYSYDIVFYNDQITDGVIDYEANLIYRTTYDTIPTLGGKRIDGQADISDGVGRAVMAGEIHDCQDRLIQHAVVGTDQADSDTVTRYFNGDTDDPQPDLTINSTNSDALYVHLNVTTDDAHNIHRVVAGVVDADCTGDDCACVSAGTATAYTFPDSVTIMTLRGSLPVLAGN